MCQVQYSFVDQHGQQASEAGVILCRLTPAAPGESGELFEVYDLLAEPIGGPLCRACSKFMQRPVRHGKTQCPHLHTKTDEYSESVKIELRKSYPDPGRIQGPQHNKQWKTTGKLPQGKFPCRVEDSRGTTCMSGHHYNTAHNANKHMLQEHNLEAGSLKLYPTTFVCTVAGCTKTFASEGKRDDHVTGHTTKPKTTTQRKTTTAAVSTAPAAAGTHASNSSEIANDVNDDHSDIEVKTAEATAPAAEATAPAGTVPPSTSYEEKRALNIATNNAYMRSLNLPAIAGNMFGKQPHRSKRRQQNISSSDTSDSDGDYAPGTDKPARHAYSLRKKVAAVAPSSQVDESCDNEAEETEYPRRKRTREEGTKAVEEVKVVPVEKTTDFCVVFGENNVGDPEVWFAVATEGEEDEDAVKDDGDRSVRWLEQEGEDGVWRTILATTYVGAEYVFTTKRVTLRLSVAGEVYELKSEDVPTEQEKAKYDKALKKKFAAPAMLPARPSTARPSTPRDESCEKKWKDVAEWQQAPEKGLYYFTLKTAECREGSHFLMSCTATTTASESAAENQRSFLTVGRVKAVNRADLTFTYTIYSAVTPANAYDSSCVEGGWVCETHATQKEPANHSDVFMYFGSLTAARRLPAAAKERARTLCPFLK
jgi:hypothetical protein